MSRKSFLARRGKEQCQQWTSWEHGLDFSCWRYVWWSRGLMDGRNRNEFSRGACHLPAVWETKDHVVHKGQDVRQKRTHCEVHSHENWQGSNSKTSRQSHSSSGQEKNPPISVENQREDIHKRWPTRNDDNVFRRDSVARDSPRGRPWLRSTVLFWYSPGPSASSSTMLFDSRPESTWTVNGRNCPAPNSPEAAVPDNKRASSRYAGVYSSSHASK